MAIDYSSPKGQIILSSICAFIGICVFVGGCIFSAHSVTAYTEWVDVESTIKSIKCETRHSGKSRNKNCDVTITYSYNNQSFVNVTGYHYTGMSNGDKLAIKVNPNDPNDYSIPASNVMMCVIIILLGLGFTLVGGYIMWTQAKKLKNN